MPFGVRQESDVKGLNLNQILKTMAIFPLLPPCIANFPLGRQRRSPRQVFMIKPLAHNDTQMENILIYKGEDFEWVKHST